jgi:hypothetical protein
MNDDAIIQQRVSGRSARAIAKAEGRTLAEVNRVIDRFTETTIDDKTRKHTLAFELARLDELQETFYARALEGDVACGALITKIIERRCVILGLYTPQTAALQIIEAEAPRETSTERIRAAIDRIRGKRHQDDLLATDQHHPPATHYNIFSTLTLTLGAGFTGQRWCRPCSYCRHR